MYKSYESVRTSGKSVKDVYAKGWKIERALDTNENKEIGNHNI
jgi:hypothetical protein